MGDAADVVMGDAADVVKAALPVSQPEATKPQPRWKIYLAEALQDQAWTECQAMRSGQRPRYLDTLAR